MTHPLAKGSKLGDYEVLRAIQSGGMGDVLLARRRGAVGFEKLFAIKTMRNDLRDVTSVRTMFADEARLLSRLAHPAIAQVHDFGEQDGVLFLAMEYVAGIGFRDLLDLDPGPGIVCRALAEACRGLHAAHELRDLSGHIMGVVHRDVSPENLMLSFEGRVKVLDFGIALVRGRQAPVTEYGTIKGKPPYLSPEQVKGEALDRRTDVFATAIVLYELLTGVQLFAGNSVYAIARAIEHREIPPPSEAAGPLPAGLDELVLRGLERNPAERFQTAQLMAEELEYIATQAAAESLDSYAMRELAGLRERHRAELRATLAGDETEPVRTRPTGSVTALAQTLNAPSARTEVATEQDSEPDRSVSGRIVAANALPRADEDAEAAALAIRMGEATTEVGVVSEASANRGRWRWLSLSMLVVLVLGAGLTIRYLSDDKATSDSVADADPKIARGGDVGPAEVRPTVILGAQPNADESPAVEQKDPPEDGPGQDAGPVDGVPARPAAKRKPGVRERPATVTDRGTEPRARKSRERGPLKSSGTPAQPGSDGEKTDRRAVKPTEQSPGERADSGTQDTVQTASKPRGFGIVNISAKPYALVRIDGKQIGTTPIIGHRLPVGRHEVVLVSPKTDEVRHRRTFDLGVGGTERIHVE